MFNKGIITLTSILLLFAVIKLAIPFQQIFHHHTEQHHAHQDGESLNSYEKPCCKSIDCFHQSSAILSEKHFSFVSFHYKETIPFYQALVTLPVSFATNKAPPVA